MSGGADPMGLVLRAVRTGYAFPHSIARRTGLPADQVTPILRDLFRRGLVAWDPLFRAVRPAPIADTKEAAA